MGHPQTPLKWGVRKKGPRNAERRGHAGERAAGSGCPMPGGAPEGTPGRRALPTALGRTGAHALPRLRTKPPPQAEGHGVQAAGQGDVQGGSLSVPAPQSQRQRGFSRVGGGGLFQWLSPCVSYRQSDQLASCGISQEVGLWPPTPGKSHENQDERVHCWEALYEMPCPPPPEDRGSVHGGEGRDPLSSWGHLQGQQDGCALTPSRPLAVGQ